MKKHLLSSALATITIAIFAQQSSTQWQATIQPQKVFIENKGQFDGSDGLPGKILFGTAGGSNLFLFSKTGITYRLEKYIPREEDDNEMLSKDGKIFAGNKKDKDEDKDKKKQEGPSGIVAVHMQWEGANPDVQLIAEDETPDYYNYQQLAKSFSGAKAFKKLIYKNLYPHIDVEYIFNPVIGVEYSLILHPGADISQVKMRYSGVSNVSMNKNGEIHLPTIYGDIIDHAPSTYYAQNKARSITSSFVCERKEVSFKLGTFDHTQTLVIDPWTVTPSMPSSNRVFYIKADSSGNAYIYGGDSPFNLQKYNSSGVLQWTYYATWDSSGTWFGALEVDRAGNSYITGGSEAGISKVNTAGSEVWLTNPTALLIEYWTLTFNCDQTKLIAGGTLNFKGTAFNIDLATGAYSTTLTAANTLGIDPDEIRTICSSPSGNYYALTLDSIVSISPTLALNYRTASTYVFGYGSPSYGLGTPQGQSCIRASSSNIYTLNGATLSKRNINTGAILSTVTIPGGVTNTIAIPVTLGGGISPGNGGIDLDSCGNVYVGSTSGVYKYDANLNLLSSATTPSAVFDVTVSTNGIVLACGQGFAVALNMGACPEVKTVCLTSTLNASLTPVNPACGGQCTGSATATAINGTGPFSYAWSDSSNTQTVSSLCAGTYTVTITDQSDNATATASTTISAPAPIVPTATATSATCGNSNGTASVSVTGGTGLTYLWNTSGTTNTISQLAGGIYSVTVTGNGNCTATASVSVSSSGGITLTPSSTGTSCGNSNGTASVSASGGSGYTYAWSGSSSVSSTISNVPGGNYIVTVTGTGNCTATASISVSSSTGITLTPSATATTCGNNNGSAKIITSGGIGTYTYTWSATGSTTDSISSVAAGIYIVTVSSNGCSASASASVGASTDVSVTTTSTPAGCTPNGTATANASGGSSYTYNWSSGATTSIASNLSGGSYTVTVNSNGCSATGTVTVTTSGGGITLSYTATPASCSNNNGTASVSTTTGTGPFTYKWNNNDTTATISGLAPGIYIVTVNGSGGCAANTSVTVTSSGGLVVTPTTISTTCGVNNGSATVGVTGGSGNYTYNWSSGAVTATSNNLASGNYTITVQDNTGCSTTASVTIGASTTASVTATTNKTIMCSGDSATVCATGNNLISYSWNTGDTTQCITTPDAGNYYVTATANGGCTAVSNHINVANYIPTPVTISVNGDTLTSYSAVSYQWYLNGQPIAGATSATIIANQSGNYTVQITDDNGCHYTSSPTTVKVTGISNIDADDAIKVYPNPLSSGNWHVDISEALVGSLCEVFDADGRIVYAGQLRSTQSEISLNVAQGVYMLQIHSAQINYNVKLIKLY